MKKTDKTGDVILLVDDDKFLLDMYSTKFREDGKKVEVCLEGKIALDRLRDGLHASAIIIDIVMPDMDGFALLEAIRKEKLEGGSAIIMLTNQGDLSDIERAKKMKVDGYIVKASAIPSEVLEQINDIIKNKKK